METGTKRGAIRPEERPEPFRRRLLAGGLLTVLCCAFTLASCAGPGAEPAPQRSEDSGQGSSVQPSPAASSTASPDAGDYGELLDPLETRRPAPGISERVLVSAQGSGTATYPVGTALASGQKVMVTASCPAGERIIIESDAGLLWTDLYCGNPAVSSYTSPPAAEAAADSEIRVSTADGSPYWLLVTLQDPVP